jgi:hypothetical protein
MIPGRDLHELGGSMEWLRNSHACRWAVRWIIGPDALDSVDDVIAIAGMFDEAYGSDDTALGRCMTILADENRDNIESCLRVLLAADALRTAPRRMH